MASSRGSPSGQSHSLHCFGEASAGLYNPLGLNGPRAAVVWSARLGAGSAPGEATPFAEVVPNQDGAGIVDAVGDGVAGLQVGQRVWIREAAWQRADGIAQEYVLLPAANVLALPGGASFDLGASLGIPVLTAQGSPGPRRFLISGLVAW